jgi:hypothetical protein
MDPAIRPRTLAVLPCAGVDTAANLPRSLVLPVGRFATLRPKRGGARILALDRPGPLDAYPPTNGLGQASP